ncbi:CAP domain-containing protein [Arthrobacter sp. zg-Y769]|uniref:CAP domain-containing protein n=1 Tax=Arthrobacter sp. zg-Y769 TaxID=2894191 RepID=UPI001E2B7E50|nr:CAP domain-containing protein [Arthrobacter sp. zg-Y769]MCC9206260.1 CAP domain-containing protein [Arthrobacter sp. zg-Y769]
MADIFAGINAFRATKGLKPVKCNPNYAASPTLAGRTRAGEVIASRYDRSGAAMVQQWINSPGHNAILSDPRLNTIGIGITYTNGSQAMYDVVNFFRYSPDHAATVASPAAVR